MLKDAKESSSFVGLKGALNHLFGTQRTLPPRPLISYEHGCNLFARMNKKSGEIVYHDR